MNKKLKLAIPFAVLACGIAAGCAGGHEHSYTEWGYNETQHWKECPDDHKKDDGTIADHVFVDGSCECGATQQTPPVTDLTITNGTTDTNGTVTLSKTTAKMGDSVTVTVAPNEGYQLKSLTVNGANVFGAMTGNTYTFTVREDTTVIAVFEKIASSSVNAVITGKKYGVAGNSLTAGTDVTLSAAGRDDVTAKIETQGNDLVLKVDEIAGDNWSVKVDGYVAATITVPRDAAYTSAIALEYDLMENLSTSWGNSDAEDLSNQNDGKIAHSSGYYQWVSSKDSYESVAITAKAVRGGFRQGVFIRFKGDNYDGDGYVMLSKENQDKISVCGAGDGFKGTNLWKDNWDEYLKPLAKDEYELTLVRDGANIHIFIDGEYKATKAIPEGYADKECYVGLFCTDATKMEKERTFGIAQASDFLEVNVTNETAADAHGTVTIDKPTAKMGDSVTVTVAPNEGYKIKDLKVGGESVLSQMTGNSYTFTVLKDTTVVAEFEESKTVDSLELSVSAAQGFTAEGTKITLEQLGETWTGTVKANGKVTLGGSEKPVAIGTHNVYADFGGYQIKLGTVSVEVPSEGTTATAEVTLGFTGSSDGNIEYAEGVSSANPATGELTYKLGKADHSAYNNKYDIVDVENGGYFATKIKFNDIGENKRSLSIILLVQKPDGTTKQIKYVIQNANRFFGEDGKFYMSLDDDSIGGGNGVFDRNNAVNIDQYSAALKGDGLWLVLGYNAETGGLVTYAGTELASMRPVKTWGSLPAGLKITDIGVGNWFGDSNQAYGGNNDTATVTFRYGATMEAIGMAIEEKVAVTASVNNEAMGTAKVDATDGMYFTDTACTVTMTAKAGYYLKSVKVGDGEEVTEGWRKDGNVYTYTFTVPAGGAAVLATFEASPEVTVTDVKVNITDGTNTIDLGETVAAKLIPSAGAAYDVMLTKGADGTYTFGGTFLRGNYKLVVLGQNVGFSPIDVVIDKDTAAVTVQYVLATATKYHHGDNNGMGECDFETLIDVDANTVKINTANANGKQVDGFWCWNSPVPEVTLNVSEEVKNATNATLEFNLKVANGNDSFNNAFGIAMAGYKGVALSLWNINDNKIDLHELTGCKLGTDGWGYADTYLEFGWIETLAESANGVNIRVVREGAKITFYAQNTAIAEGEQWVIFFETTCDESAKTDIKFLGMGSDYTVSDISVTVNETSNEA